MKKPFLFLILALLMLSGCGQDRVEPTTPPGATPPGFVLEKTTPAETGPELTSLPETTLEETLPETTPEETFLETGVIDLMPSSSRWYGDLLDSMVHLDSYSYYDIDRDGRVELIAKVGHCEADYAFQFYRYQSGQPQFLGWIGGAVSYLASDGEDLIITGGRQGHEWSYYVDIFRNEIRIKEEHSKDVGMDGEYTQYPFEVKAHCDYQWDRSKSPVRGVFTEDADVPCAPGESIQVDWFGYEQGVTLSTWETVDALCILRMGYTPSGKPTEGEVAYSFGRLASDEHVEFKMSLSQEEYALRFVDKTGKTWHLAIETDGQTGSLKLTPFTPSKPQPGEGAFTLDGLWVQDADSVALGEHLSFVATESPYHERVLLGTNKTIRDFRLVKLTADFDTWETVVEKEVYARDSLTPGLPIVLTVTTGEVMPEYAVCHTDGNGVTHYYAIETSGEDGSLYLRRITPAIRGPEPEPTVSDYEACPTCGGAAASCPCPHCANCGVLLKNSDDPYLGYCEECYYLQETHPNVLCPVCYYRFYWACDSGDVVPCPLCGSDIPIFDGRLLAAPTGRPSLPAKTKGHCEALGSPKYVNARQRKTLCRAFTIHL